MSFVAVAAQMAIQAAIQAAQGKSGYEIGRTAGKTALSGAIGGAIGGGLGGGTMGEGIGGTIGGAATSAAFGENVGEGALYGGLSGAVRGYSQGEGQSPSSRQIGGEDFKLSNFGENFNKSLPMNTLTGGPTDYAGAWDRYKPGIGKGETLLPDFSVRGQEAAKSALDKTLTDKISGGIVQKPAVTPTTAPNTQVANFDGRNVPRGLGVGQVPGVQPNVTNISVPAAPKAPVEEGMLGKNTNLKALAGLAALGGGAYMLSGNTGAENYNDPNAKAKEELYPISLASDFKAPPDIKRATVPRYYSKEGGIIQEQGYAEGGSAVDTSGPMNPFAEMGVAHAQQQMQATQAQMPQQGIPRGYASGGNIDDLIKAGMGKELGPGVAQALGSTKGTAGANDAFMDLVKAQMSMQMQGPQAAQAAIPATPQQQVAPPTPMNPAQQPITTAAGGGLMGISDLGGYAHGGIPRLTRGPGDGVSDSIPAEIGSTGKQPARLADGEFVVPARIVSELGNGSTEAGARELQGMMDRVQKRRKKTVGKGKIAVDSKARKVLPA